VVSRARSAPLCLGAVVPASELRRPGLTMRGVRYISYGPVAACAGRPSRRPTQYAARCHDRILGRLVEVCSAVVPFRFGVELASDTALRRFLELNLEPLGRHLARVRGRVEMGAKVKLSSWDPAAALRLRSSLRPIRALAPEAVDRRERLRRVATGRIFEGCYLIARRAVEDFWSAVDESRSALGDLPVLGSGPWAAYSFCDFVLRPGLAQPEAG
jgi:hypothetical protein